MITLNLIIRKAIFLLLAAIFSAGLPTPLSAERSISDGHYLGSGDIDFAVFRSGDLIQGSFFSQVLGSDNNPKFTCDFRFLGIRIAENKFVSFSFDHFGTEPIIGIIRIDGTTLRFRLAADMPGCGNVAPLSQGQGEMFQISPAKRSNDYSELDSFQFSSMSRVTGDKVFFHSSPNDNSKTRSFVIKNQIVLTGTTQNGYTQTAFIGEKVTIGWLANLHLSRVWVE